MKSRSSTTFRGPLIAILAVVFLLPLQKAHAYTLFTMSDTLNNPVPATCNLTSIWVKEGIVDVSATVPISPNIFSSGWPGSCTVGPWAASADFITDSLPVGEYTVFIGTSAGSNINSATSVYGNFFWDGLHTTPFIDSDSTHFVSISPPTNTIQATTTTVAYDFKYNETDTPNLNDPFLRVFYNDQVQQSGAYIMPLCSQAQPLNCYKDYPVSGGGEYTFSSSTTFSDALGRRTMNFEFRQHGNFLLGFFYDNSSIVVSTSTTFAIGGLSQGDMVSDEVGNIISGIGNGTSTAALLNNCSILTFDLWHCVLGMLIPDETQIAQNASDFNNLFLKKAPWGYATRFITILATSSTTPLTTWTADIQIGPAATTTLTFDMNDMITGGAALLDSVTDPNSGLNEKEILRPYVDLFILISLLIIIFHDIMGMGHHVKGNPKKQ